MSRTKSKPVSLETQKAEVKVEKSKTVVVEITAPVVEHGKVFLSRVECKLTPRQARALRLLFDGLAANGERVQLGNVRDPVQQQHDGIRWVLDQIADSVGLPGGAPPLPDGQG